MTPPRDFSNIPRWSLRPEYHVEQDTSIDRKILSMASAIGCGRFTEEQAIEHLCEDNTDVADAINILRAAQVLVSHDGK